MKILNLGINQNDDNLEWEKLKEWEAIKCLYSYSRSRYSRIHMSKEFRRIFSYAYTQKVEGSDKSWLESIYEVEKETAKDKIRFSESFNSLYARFEKYEADAN